MQSRKVFQKGLPLHGLSFCRQILFLAFYPVAPKQFRNALCKGATRSRHTAKVSQISLIFVPFGSGNRPGVTNCQCIKYGT